jgi:ATP-dependent Zn protease
MEIVNTTATFGKIRMDFTIVISIIVAIMSAIILLWLITSFETNYITKTATIIEDPACTTDKNVTTGTITVKFRYNNKDYSLKVNVGQGCYNYTKNSNVKVKFDPNNIESTIIIESDDPKTAFIIITVVFLIISILIFVYNYVFINNKVAQTISGGEGIAQGIRSIL